MHGAHTTTAMAKAGGQRVWLIAGVVAIFLVVWLVTQDVLQCRSSSSQQALQLETLQKQVEQLPRKLSDMASSASNQALHLATLQQRVDQLPQSISALVSSRLKDMPVQQKHTTNTAALAAEAADHTQTAALQTMTSSRDNPIGSRMVSFMGHNLLVLALKNDEHVGGFILKSGEPYEALLLGAMLNLVAKRPGSTVLDVGANIGSYSIFFAAITGPQGRVYSFEPQRKMYQVLCANAMVNGLMNVYPQHVALSFAADKVTMAARVPDGVAAGQNITEAEKKQGLLINYGGMPLGKGGESVQSMTLDSYNLTNVSLIKLDVQGAEALAVFGGQDTIRRNLPVVVCEDMAHFRLSDDMVDALHVPEAVRSFNIGKFLRSLGYQPKAHQPLATSVIWLPPNHV